MSKFIIKSHTHTSYRTCFKEHYHCLRHPVCSSVVECPLIVPWLVGLIPLGGPIELFLAAASVPRMV